MLRVVGPPGDGAPERQNEQRHVERAAPPEARVADPRNGQQRQAGRHDEDRADPPIERPHAQQTKTGRDKADQADRGERHGHPIVDEQRSAQWQHRVGQAMHNDDPTECANQLQPHGPLLTAVGKAKRVPAQKPAIFRGLP
jgi:hypothetical protein